MCGHLGDGESVGEARGALMTCARCESWGVPCTAWSSVVLQAVCSVSFKG